MDTEEPNKVRIVLIDDQEVDRTTLRGVLALEIPGAEVLEVGSAASLVNALEGRVDASTPRSVVRSTS
jgi:CheY-like chemotaxis protein